MSDVQKVRDLIPDIEEVDWQDDGSPSQMFNDAQIETYLSVNDGNVKRAAADAIRALAVSEGLISKVVKTEDLQTDGAKLASALRSVAADLEESADREDDRDNHGFFSIAPFRPAPPNQGWRPFL